MSDNEMTIIPSDPFAQPSPAQREAVLAALKRMRPTADEFELRESDTPDIFHCGVNLETIFCPFCQAEIEKDGWYDMVNQWYEGDRTALGIVTPCCARETSLNDLDYDWPMGFACFGVEVLNPWGDLEPQEVAEIEALLGQPIRVIWQHI